MQHASRCIWLNLWVPRATSWHRKGTIVHMLDCKEVQPVHPKGDQSWVFIGRTDAEAETPILWPSDSKNWLIWKDPDAGKDWRLEEKGTTEDEMAGWHHRLDRHESEWTLGVGDGQGGLACCSSWGCKGLDTTERLNWTDWSLTEHHLNVKKNFFLLIFSLHNWITPSKWKLPRINSS